MYCEGSSNLCCRTCPSADKPVINLGGLDYRIWDNGWTVQNTDYRFSAQFEHTIVITDDGNEILTVPDAHYFDGLDSFYAK